MDLISESINRARIELNELQDEMRPQSRGGNQMHRRAVVGKRLHAAACSRYFYSQSTTPFRVEIRVDGQYSPFHIERFSSMAEAESFAKKFNKIHPVGITS